MQTPAPLSRKKPYGFVSNLNALRRAGYDDNLQNMTFRVFGLILSYANNHGICFPSISNMAKKLKISRQAVQQQVRALIAMGYLKTTPQHGKMNIFHVIQKNPPDCILPQHNHIAPPAIQLHCTKKTIKKPYKETTSSPIAEAVKKRRDYMQAKGREAQTGISQADELALTEIMHNATLGMGITAKINLDCDLKQEAVKLYTSKKEQHDYLRQRYTEIYSEHLQADKITI